MRRRYEVRSHDGGVITRVTPELLRSNQLSRARNAREPLVGAVGRRGGSKRLNASAWGTSGGFQGITQWSYGGGEEVAVRNGNLYADGMLKASGLDATADVSFAVHREAGSPVLYAADGTNLIKYDGSSATFVAGAPAMSRIAVYNSRLFGIEGSTAHYSAIDSPDDYSVASDAGNAKVETYDYEDLQALTVLGSSLLLFKEDNISRFTGYSKYDIDLDTGTDGISDEVGIIAPDTLVRVEDVAFFLSDRGPYFATTSGVREVGFNVEPIFDFDDRTTFSKATAVHNRRRREIWLFLPSSGSSQNDTCWVLNYRTMTWWGPWDFPFNVSKAARFEKSTGVESVLLGGYDGFLRDGDESGTSILDDVLSDDTGGSRVPFEVGYAPILLDLNTPKRFGPKWQVRADLGSDGVLVCDITNEHGDTFQSAPIKSKGSGVRNYEFRPPFAGKQLTVTFSDISGEPVQIHSFQADLNVGSDT